MRIAIGIVLIIILILSILPLVSISDFGESSSFIDTVIDIFAYIGTAISNLFNDTQRNNNVTTVATRVIDGITYTFDTLAETIVDEMERMNHLYFPALRIDDAIQVAPVPITIEQAQYIVRLNDNRIGVFALSESHARAVVSAPDMGGYRGPEGRTGPGYWRHYHANNFRASHVWFIG